MAGPLACTVRSCQKAATAAAEAAARRRGAASTLVCAPSVFMDAIDRRCVHESLSLPWASEHALQVAAGQCAFEALEVAACFWKRN